MARARRFASDASEAEEVANSSSDEEGAGSEEDKKEDDHDPMAEDSSEGDSDGENSDDDSDQEEEGEDEDFDNPLDWAISNLQELSLQKDQFSQLCYYTIGEILLQVDQEIVDQILESPHIRSSLFPARFAEFSASQLYFAFLLERHFQVCVAHHFNEG